MVNVPVPVMFIVLLVAGFWVFAISAVLFMETVSASTIVEEFDDVILPVRVTGLTHAPPELLKVAVELMFNTLSPPLPNCMVTALLEASVLMAVRVLAIVWFAVGVPHAPFRAVDCVPLPVMLYVGKLQDAA